MADHELFRWRLNLSTKKLVELFARRARANSSSGALSSFRSLPYAAQVDIRALCSEEAKTFDCGCGALLL